MTHLTDAGTLARLAYQGLINLGVDANQVLKRSGMDPDRLYQTNLRTPFSAQPSFWQAALDLSNDPCIGLHIGEKMPLYKGQIIEYLFLSSANFGDGLRRNIRYQRLVSDALHVKLVEQPKPYITAHISEREFLTSHFAEILTVGVIKAFGEITDGHFKPKKFFSPIHPIQAWTNTAAYFSAMWNLMPRNSNCTLPRRFWITGL